MDDYKLDIDDPVIQAMMNNGMVKNPAYNPKTKKGSLQPKYIRSNTIPIVGQNTDPQFKLNEDVNVGGRDLGISPEEFKENPSEAIKSNIYGTDAVERGKADKQAWYEQAGNALVQAVGSEVVLGTLRGLSDIADGLYNLYNDAQRRGEMVYDEKTNSIINKRTGEALYSNDFTNPLSTQLEEAQDWVREKFAIHQQDPNSTFNITDTGWWFNGLVSAASTLSLMLPALGYTRALSFAGRLSRLDKGLNAIYKALGSAGKVEKSAKLLGNAEAILRHGESIGNAARMTELTGNVANTASMAFFSRMGEGYLEARENYKTIFNNAMTSLNNMNDKHYAEFIERNPQFANKSKEEIADNIASEGARDTYIDDYAMLAMDFLQYRALGNMWKGSGFRGVNSATTAEVRLAERNAEKMLTKEGRNSIENNIFKDFVGRRIDSFKYALKHPTNSFSALELGEGFEEWYQGIQLEQGENVGKRYFDPTIQDRNIYEYLTDTKLLEEGFFGALGGIIFNKFGNLSRQGVRRVKAELYKRDMKKENLWDDAAKTTYDNMKMSDDKRRIAEIQGRIAINKKFIEDIQSIDEGYNPFDTIKTKDGETYKKIEERDKEILKEQAINNYVMTMATNAAANGNIDLLLDYVKSPEFNKYFTEELGLDRSFGEGVANKLEKSANLYEAAFSKIIHSVDGADLNSADMAARKITSKYLNIDKYNTELGLIDDKLSEYSDDGNINDSYYKDMLSVYVKSEIDRCNAEFDRAEEKYNNKELTKYQIEDLRKKYRQHVNTLLEFAADNTDFMDEEGVKDILNVDLSARNINEFIFKLNSYIYKNDLEFDGTLMQKMQALSAKKVSDKTAPNNVAQQLIDRKIAHQWHLYKENKTIPITKKDYIDFHDRYFKAQSNYNRKRILEAFHNIGERIKDFNSIDEAWDAIIDNNLGEEYNDDLDILKIGSEGMEEFTLQMQLFISSVFNEKETEAAEKEKEEKEVIVNGKRISSKKIEETPTENNVFDENEDDDPSTGEETLPTFDNEENEFISDEDVLEDYGEELLENDFETDEDVENYFPNTDLEFDSDLRLLMDEDPVMVQQSIDNIIDKEFRKNFDKFTDAFIFNDEELKNDITNNILEQCVGEHPLIDEDELMNYIKKGIVSQMGHYGNMNKKVGNLKKGSEFDTIALQLANDFELDDRLSVTKFITEDKRDELVEKLIKSFIDKKELRKVSETYIIDIVDILNDLLDTSDMYSMNDIIHIIQNIKDAINAIDNTKLITENIEIFENKLNIKFKNKSKLNNILNNPVPFLKQISLDKSSKTTINEMHAELVPDIAIEDLKKISPKNIKVSLGYNISKMDYKDDYFRDKESVVFYYDDPITKKRTIIARLAKPIVEKLNGNDKIIARIAAKNTKENNISWRITKTDDGNGNITYVDEILDEIIYDIIRNPNSEISKAYEIYAAMQIAENNSDRIKYQKDFIELTKKLYYKDINSPSAERSDLAKKLFNVNLNRGTRNHKRGIVNFVGRSSNPGVIAYGAFFEELQKILNSRIIPNTSIENIYEINYEEWKQKIFDNYVFTAKLMGTYVDETTNNKALFSYNEDDINALFDYDSDVESGSRIEKLVNILGISGEIKKYPVKIINNTSEHDITDNKNIAKLEQNKEAELYVVKEGSSNLETENGTSDNNPFMFVQNDRYQGRSYGIRIKKGENDYDYAFITRENQVSEDIQNVVKKEFHNILKSYQDGIITYEETYKKLESLFGGSYGKIFKNNIICLEKENKRINIGYFEDKKFTPVVTIYKSDDTKPNARNVGYRDDSFKENKKGQKVLYSYKYNEKRAEIVLNKLVKNLKWNMSYIVINDMSGNNRNEYFYKDKNGVHFTLTGKTYNSYLHFYIEQNAFKTTADTKNLFINAGNNNNCHIGINKIDKIEEIPEEATKERNIDKFVKKRIGKKDEVEIDTKDVLEQINKYSLSSELLKDLDGNGTSILLPTVWFSKKLGTDVNAKYNKFLDEIHIAQMDGRKSNSWSKNNNDLFRNIVHENIHRHFSNLTPEQQKRININLEKLYKYAKSKINRDVLQQLIDNKTLAFKNPEDCFVWYEELIKVLDSKDGRIRGEEFLAEALSQEVFAKILNNIEYTDDAIIDSNKEHKSLFQKIIDILYRIIGVSVQDNTVLAKLYNELTINEEEISSPVKEQNNPNATNTSEDNIKDTEVEVKETETNTTDTQNVDKNGHIILDIPTQDEEEYDDESDSEYDDYESDDDDLARYSTTPYIEEDVNGNQISPDMNTLFNTYNNNVKRKLADLMENEELIYVCW